MKKIKANIRVIYLKLRDTNSHQKLGEEHGADSPSEPPAGINT
jgi:hypothetical protein